MYLYIYRCTWKATTFIAWPDAIDSIRMFSVSSLSLSLSLFIKKYRLRTNRIEWRPAATVAQVVWWSILHRNRCRTVMMLMIVDNVSICAFKILTIDWKRFSNMFVSGIRDLGWWWADTMCIVQKVNVEGISVSAMGEFFEFRKSFRFPFKWYYVMKNKSFDYRRPKRHSQHSIGFFHMPKWVNGIENPASFRTTCTNNNKKTQTFIHAFFFSSVCSSDSCSCAIRWWSMHHFNNLHKLWCGVWEWSGCHYYADEHTVYLPNSSDMGSLCQIEIDLVVSECKYGAIFFTLQLSAFSNR